MCHVGDVAVPLSRTYISSQPLLPRPCSDVCASSPCPADPGWSFDQKQSGATILSTSLIISSASVSLKLAKAVFLAKVRSQPMKSVSSGLGRGTEWRFDGFIPRDSSSCNGQLSPDLETDMSQRGYSYVRTYLSILLDGREIPRIQSGGVVTSRS